MLPPTKRDPHTCIGVASYPTLETTKRKKTKNQNQQPEHEDMLIQEILGEAGGTPKCHQGYRFRQLRLSPPQNSTAIDSIVIIKDCNRQYSCYTFYFGFYQNYGFYQSYLTSNVVGF